MEYKEGLIKNIYFGILLIVYTDVLTHSRRKFSLLCCELFIEHLSVFLDMVNIKHNKEL